MDKDEQLALDLMVTLMDQNAQQANYLTNSLMEGYQRDYRLARAEIALIRDQVKALFLSGYMPTESAIIRALYPDSAEIEYYAKLKEG